MYENIVNVPSTKIKEIARNVLSGRWKEFVIGCLIYYGLSQLVQDILGVYFGRNQTIEYSGFSYNVHVNYGGGIYQIILGGALVLGFTMYALHFFRTKKTSESLLFEGFSYFGKATLLNIYMSILITLWTLLFVIPGIIAMYRYRLAYYVMADHPEYSVSQCVRESKRLMMGNKGRLFGLDLSFIGWYILAVLPATIMGTYFNGSIASLHPLIQILVAAIFALPSVVLLAYTETANVAFYQLATGRLAVVDPQCGYGNVNGGNGYYGNGGNDGYNRYGGNGGYQGGNYNKPSGNQGNFPQDQNSYPSNGSNLPKSRRDIDKEPDNSGDLD